MSILPLKTMNSTFGATLREQNPTIEFRLKFSIKKQAAYAYIKEI